MKRTSPTRRKAKPLTRRLSPKDAAEVSRFNQYLADKASNMPAEQFSAKWANYEQGKE